MVLDDETVLRVASVLAMPPSGCFALPPAAAAAPPPEFQPAHEGLADPWARPPPGLPAPESAPVPFTPLLASLAASLAPERPPQAAGAGTAGHAAPSHQQPIQDRGVLAELLERLQDGTQRCTLCAKLVGKDSDHLRSRMHLMRLSRWQQERANQQRGYPAPELPYVAWVPCDESELASKRSLKCLLCNKWIADDKYYEPLRNARRTCGVRGPQEEHAQLRSGRRLVRHPCGCRERALAPFHGPDAGQQQRVRPADYEGGAFVGRSTIRTRHRSSGPREESAA